MSAVPNAGQLARKAKILWGRQDVSLQHGAGRTPPEVLAGLATTLGTVSYVEHAR